MTEFEVSGLTSFGLFGFDWKFMPFASSDSVVSWQTSKGDAFSQFLRIAAQSGPSPTTRAGMDNTAVAEDDNPFEEYL